MAEKITMKCFYKFYLYFLLSTLFIRAVPGYAQEFDHGVWDKLLKESVHAIQNGHATQVDYDAFVTRHTELKLYLENLAKVSKEEFDAWSSDHQLAFLINAYNSWTIELILTRYPDLDSIKDLGALFSSPWDKEIVLLFGAKYSLDDIEHGLIRGSGRYNDPRIHFAVNCASIGCPALRPEAYQGVRLQEQLDEATALFLQDRTRNRLKGDYLEVSKIFKWYKEDFEKGWLGYHSLGQFFVARSKDLNLTEGQKQELSKGNMNIKYLSYDWRLNKIQQ